PVLASVVFPASTSASLYVCAPLIDTLSVSVVVVPVFVDRLVSAVEAPTVLPKVVVPVVCTPRSNPPFTVLNGLIAALPVLASVVFPASTSASSELCSALDVTLPVIVVVPPAS